MHLLDPLGKNYPILCEIFEKVSSKNAVALLGAGASVTNKQFLSKELIELYQARIGKSFGTDDIIKFVDILQATPGMRRADFDRFVVDRLTSLTPNEGHRIFVTIPWKQVITTNYDTLVEEASNDAIRANKTHLNLKVVRHKKQLDFQSSNNEIVYVKLNGCKTDLSLYPLVFSTEEFAQQSPYYKKVLSPLRTFSNDITYLSFGYSFTDIFAERLLEKLINNDYRQKRRVFCIDPFINEDKLGYFESLNISIVKLSFEEFFISYQKWFEDNHKSYLKNLQRFTNPDNSKIQIDATCRLYLDKDLVQLKDTYKSTEKVKKLDFYIGEEPNYEVVLEEFDVIRLKQLNELLCIYNNYFDEDSYKTTIPKLVLINGDFGSGKTTFTLRSIKELLKRNQSMLAFEIVKSIGVKKGYLAQLIIESTANRFVFYCDNIEIDSVFKAFNDLRVDLASEQYSDIKILFVSSIRSNILSKYKNNHNVTLNNCEEFEYNAVYTDDELGCLVDNLKELELIAFRDLEERKEIIRNIKRDYKGDSFITLYKLIQNGSHYKLLQKAYEELTTEIKLAFKLTALIHRFGIECPVSVIKSAIKDINWEEFTERVVKGDGKNILFNEFKPTTKSEPDLFFRTKHPVIAEALIQTILKNTEKNALYKSIFSSLTFSEFNSRFIVDLIKGIRLNDSDVTPGQIDNYYELCRKEFESSPHFLISYVTNIEKNTNSISALRTCIKDIEVLEGGLDYRNNRLIHRKGSLYFKIARLQLSNSEPMSEVIYHLNAAEEWFFIKKQMDPSSNYSYRDYFQLLLWKIAKIKLDTSERLKVNLTLNNLFDEAFRLLSQDLKEIYDFYEQYNRFCFDVNDRDEYIDFLKESYQSVESRPKACILLYYYYETAQDYEKCYDLLDELTKYGDDKDVVYFLFKFYGRNLYSVENRMKYFELLRQNSFLEEFSPFRYNYYSGISEFYNYRWHDGREYLNELKNIKQSTFNHDFFLYWCDEDGNERVFEAEVKLEKKKKGIMITAPFYRNFRLVNGDYRELSVGDKVNVKLRFFFEGIKAELVDINSLN